MTANTTDPIASTLGVTPLTQENQPLVPMQDGGTNTMLQDIEYARENMYELIEKGHSMLSDIFEIAAQAQSAKVYEVATQLLRTMAQTNLDLIEIQQRKRALSQGEGPRVVNNNLTLTTNDLIRLIKNSGKTE